MRSVTYALPALPGIAGFLKTYAPWPVWSGSARGEIRFAPMSRKERIRIWHRARRFEPPPIPLGENGKPVVRPVRRVTWLQTLNVALFDFLDTKTGQLDPSLDTFAKKAGICRRALQHALNWLRWMGLLNWQRRCEEDRDADGRYRLRQRTNCYAVLPPSQWRGYREPPQVPPPEPGTWGEPLPLPPEGRGRGVAGAIDVVIACDRVTLELDLLPFGKDVGPPADPVGTAVRWMAAAPFGARLRWERQAKALGYALPPAATAIANLPKWVPVIAGLVCRTERLR